MIRILLVVFFRDLMLARRIGGGLTANLKQSPKALKVCRYKDRHWSKRWLLCSADQLTDMTTSTVRRGGGGMRDTGVCPTSVGLRKRPSDRSQLLTVFSPSGLATCDQTVGRTVKWIGLVHPPRM
jgi:hypothetical protein